MTNHDADLEPSIQVLIDRMIDGEMSPQHLRVCIERLDSAPDGWRRCALAFLEAQSWGEAFRNMDETPRDRSLVIAGSTKPPLAARAPMFPQGRARSALAAGIAILGFSLGWMGHSLNARGKPTVAPVETALAKPVERVIDGPEMATTKMPWPGAITGLPTDRIPTIREVARLRIGTSDQAAAEVPILTGPGIGGRWLMEQPPPVSDHDRAVWQRQGYQLEQRRRLVSVPLADGRRAAVPIDHVQVRYIGHNPL